MPMSPNTALISVAGAVFLILYGMNTAGDAIQRVAGHRLRQLPSHVGKSRVASAALGAAVRALTQSIVATTLMLVGFARAGLVQRLELARKVLQQEAAINSHAANLACAVLGEL